MIDNITPTPEDLAKAWEVITPIARQYEQTHTARLTHREKMALDLVCRHQLKCGRLNYSCNGCIKTFLNNVIKHLNNNTEVKEQTTTNRVEQLPPHEVEKLKYNDLVKYARAMGLVIKPGIKKPQLLHEVLNM